MKSIGRYPPTTVSLAEKLDFLRRPEAYPMPTRRVELKETHMSWVFLTDRHVYKLKKPVRYSFLDYSTLERRRAMCNEEIRLNRRLAGAVYLGVAAVTRDPSGNLALVPAGREPEGDAVEWLVQMVRLSDALLLDNAIGRDTVNEADARRTARHLAAFYASAEPLTLTSSELVTRFARAISENADGIVAAGVAPQLISDSVRSLRRFLDSRQRLLASRAEQKRLVEGHGDLRPEHVFLGRPPAIIDCIEFSYALRQVDPLEELAFLRTECLRLGAVRWGDVFLEAYLRKTGDDCPDELLWFYMCERACLRARLTLGHLADTDVREPQKWRRKADVYLALANEFAGKI